MKTMWKQLVIPVVSMVLFASCASDLYVTDRPADPYYAQPAPPYAGAVWIGGEWVPRGRRYEYVAPHYVRPRSGRNWAPGHWQSGPRGHVWVRGGWR